MGHHRKPTRLKTDNKTANSFVHAEMKLRRSKTWDMRYNWIKEMVSNKLVDIFWDKRSNNDADYFTKLHNKTHHQKQRPRYILKGFFKLKNIV